MLTSKGLKDELICVDIILATYNGEKYLGEFLDSLIHQSHQDWLLFISDDGSADATVSIINNYCARDARIILVNSERQGGVVQNFAKCLTYSFSPYIMFADQDDVWLPKKIELLLNKIICIESSFTNHQPILVFSDLTLVNHNLDIISESFYKHNHLNPLNNIQYKFLYWRSTVFGCSVIFNKSLNEIVGEIDERVMMHDHIFAFAASLFGTVAYLDKPTVLYRQHSTNLIGGVNRNILYKIGKIKFYLDSLVIYKSKLKNQLFFIQEKFINTHSLTEKNQVKPYKLNFLNANLSSPYSKILFIINIVLPYAGEKTLFTILLAGYILLT